MTIERKLSTNEALRALGLTKQVSECRIFRDGKLVFVGRDVLDVNAWLRLQDGCPANF